MKNMDHECRHICSWMFDTYYTTDVKAFLSAQKLQQRLAVLNIEMDGVGPSQKPHVLHGLRLYQGAALSHGSINSRACNRSRFCGVLHCRIEIPFWSFIGWFRLLPMMRGQLAQNHQAHHLHPNMPQCHWRQRWPLPALWCQQLNGVYRMKPLRHL